MNPARIAMLANAILAETSGVTGTSIVPDGYVRVTPNGPAADGGSRDYPRQATFIPQGNGPVNCYTYAVWLGQLIVTGDARGRRPDGTPYCTPDRAIMVIGAPDQVQAEMRDWPTELERDQHYANAVDMLMHWHDWASQAELDSQANQARADAENFQAPGR